VTDRAQLNEEIIDNYRLVVRGIDRVMLPRLIELGLTMPQFKALIDVFAAGSSGISVTELGNDLSVGQPSASLITDQLVRLGYVQRVQDQKDRRRVLVTITDQGADLAAELRQGRRDTLREWLSELTDDAATCLLEGVRAWAKSVEANPAGRLKVH
jgi:DNA-binding MarR family transcriptional regulator